MLMRLMSVRVVPLRPAVRGDLKHLTNGDQLAERAVHGGPGDLRQSLRGTDMDFVGRVVDMLAIQHLGDDSPLRGEPPAAIPEPLQQVTHGYHPSSALFKWLEYV
jgi:hypothetical protein